MNLKLYLIIITIVAIITSLITSFCFEISFIYVFGVMWLGIILVIAIDGITSAICRFLPKGCANFNSKIYLVSKKEKKFYDNIKIKSWKEKIPEIGHLTGFRKNKVIDPKNKDYIHRFLTEICYGELGHFISQFTGLLLLLLPFFKPIWVILCIVIVAVNAILNLLPLFVLRYNSYALLRVYERLIKNEARQAKE